MGNYQELIFYQKARQVVKAVDALIKSWSKTMQAQEISRQLFDQPPQLAQMLQRDMEGIRVQSRFTT